MLWLAQESFNMLTNRDVSQLDEAFNNLSGTLMQNRVMKAQQQERQQEQQRLQQNATDEQQYRNTSLKDKEDQDKVMADIANRRLQGEDTANAERARHDKAEESAVSAKQMTSLFTPLGDEVKIPSSSIDAHKKAYASQYPGQQLTETNPYYQVLDISGVPHGYTSQKEYNAAALKLAQMTKQNGPKTVTNIKTGTAGGFPIDETNVTTTATAPMPLSGAAPSPQQFTKGQKVQQNGVTYQYDGQNWNPISQ